MHIAAALFIFSQTLALALEEEGFYQIDCKRICQMLLQDYRERMLQTCPWQTCYNTPVKQKSCLVVWCNTYVNFTRNVGEPVDGECPNLCDRLVTTILNDKNLQNQLRNDCSPEPQAMVRFCNNYKYK
ncbi:hypothetical protein OESDEN_19129 [Oesophagostomum dentatum]|uniref:Uncharacterized protein n=1 Tax=Oesophagostomum dentatum TaxID=61180 RepID=A0A0B1SDC5_OESDE|nr:hypothetical protein OESDEN_19129 [Oesophagostomum dentatum]